MNKGYSFFFYVKKCWCKLIKLRYCYIENNSNKNIEIGIDKYYNFITQKYLYLLGKLEFGGLNN